MRTKVVIKTRFSAIHNWPECPIDEVHYLTFPHRHEFHVTMKFNVEHNDRDIEFINMKNKVEEYLLANYERKDLGRRSCEDMARELALEFGACDVSIFEDGENGAEVSI